MRRNRNQAGVTLIEMLVVVTIIGLFVALVGPPMVKHAGQAKVIAARTQIYHFMTALGAYKLDTGQFPDTDQGLTALEVKPTDVEGWNGQYLPRDIPKDPWQKAYLYRFPGEHRPGEPDIISLGADGKPGGEGFDADIVSWQSK
jgi:general secretion pathway protein G